MTFSRHMTPECGLDLDSRFVDFRVCQIYVDVFLLPFLLV